MTSRGRMVVALLAAAGFVLLALGAMTIGEARTLTVRGVEVAVSPVSPADARGWFEMGGRTYVVDQRSGTMVADPRNPALHAPSAGAVMRSAIPALGLGLLLLALGASVGHASAGRADERAAAGGARSGRHPQRRTRRPQLAN